MRELLKVILIMGDEKMQNLDLLKHVKPVERKNITTTKDTYTMIQKAKYGA